VRILFSSTAGVGHFRSLMPFIDACVARGEQTLVAGPQRLAVMAKTRGYRFAPFGTPPDRLEHELRSRLSDTPKESVLGEIYGRLRPRASLPVLTDICQSWQPDVVVRDRAEFGSALAAELAQIPVIRVSRLASFERHVIRQCAPPLDELRDTLGLPEDPDGTRVGRSPSLTFWPASLEDPNDDARDTSTMRFRDPTWDAPARRLGHDWGAGGEPLIYMTFGTVTGSLSIGSKVYTTAIEATDGLPVRGLLTAGLPDGEPHQFGDLPPNLRAESWVDEADVVPEAAAVVCHGGAGSILTAAAAGIPLVIVPLFGDQHANARRVGELGAGIVTELDADSIRRGILGVLREDAYRSRAGALAEEMRTHAPCATAVDVVGRVAAASATGSRRRRRIPPA
jgi:UDP:flavonoid glycosyltransferase YjiC (YdhE family)